VWVTSAGKENTSLQIEIAGPRLDGDSVPRRRGFIAYLSRIA